VTDTERPRTTRGGVLLRVDGAFGFLPASVAVRVAPSPRVTPVPGAPPGLLGITLYEGAIVAVIAIGAARREMVVCQFAGELIGLVGGEVVRTGVFDVTPDEPDCVEHEGQRARDLNLGVLYGRVQTGARAGRRTHPSAPR
jgi:hypothetical protein